MGYDPYWSGFGSNSWKVFEERQVLKDDLSRKEITR